MFPAFPVHVQTAILCIWLKAHDEHVDGLVQDGRNSIFLDSFTFLFHIEKWEILH